MQALALMHKGPGLFPRPLHALQQQLEQQQQWVQAIGKGARRHCDPHALFGPYRAFNMEVEAGVTDVALVLCNDKVWRTCGEFRKSVGMCEGVGGGVDAEVSKCGGGAVK